MYIKKFEISCFQLYSKQNRHINYHPAQEEPDEELTKFVKDSEATLNDYDIYLKSLEEAKTINAGEYKDLASKIAKAIIDMKNADNLEAAKAVFDEIQDEVIKGSKSNTDAEDLAEAVEEVKQEIADKKKVLADLLNTYKDVAKEIEDITPEDLEMLNSIIDGAQRATNNAKTKGELGKVQSDFEALMDSMNSELKTEVNTKNELVTAQNEALKKFDAYKATLDSMTDLDSNQKQIIENALKTARTDTMNAKDSDGVDAAVKAFEDQMKDYHKDIIDETAEKLLTDALNKAIEKLEAYKTGAYADAEYESSKTIKQKVDDYIEELKTQAESLKATLTTESYETIDETANSKCKDLDEKIKNLKKADKVQKANYVEAYNKAMEELNVYAENAKKFGLSTEELNNINSLIDSTKSKIGSVNTDKDVESSMELFRDAVSTFSSEFDKYQLEETKKSAQEELKTYKGITEEIDDLVDTGISSVKSGTSVNKVMENLQAAIDEIEKAIAENEGAKAKADALKLFNQFLQDEGKYSTAIHGIAGKAMDELKALVSDNLTKENVEKIQKEYMNKIDEQLKKEGTTLEELKAEAREEAKEAIALYKELAQKSNDSALLEAITPYENIVDSESSDLSAIENATVELKAYIDSNASHKLVSTKLKDIETIESIDNEENSDWVTAGHSSLTGKLAENKYVKAEMDKVIANIKNAENDENLTKALTDGEKAINDIIEALNTMEEKRNAAVNTTLNTVKDIDKALSVKETYTEKINAVTYDDYKNYKPTKTEATIFDALIKEAGEAVKNYLDGQIVNEAEANLTVSEKDLKDKFSGNDTNLLGSEKTVDELQSNVKIEDGKVYGKLTKQDDFSQFSESEKAGYFLCLTFTSETAKKIEVTRYVNNIETKTVTIDNNEIVIIRFENEEQKNQTKLEVKFYNETEEEPVNTITIDDFTELTW